MSKLKLKKSLAAKKAFYYLLVFAIPLLFSSASYAYVGKVSPLVLVLLMKVYPYNTVDMNAALAQ